jgi:Ca2+-transporting ATPase
VALYGSALALGRGDLQARALTFTALILANLGLILTNRSWSRSLAATFRVPNAAFWWVLVSALALLALVLWVPEIRDAFRFSPVHLVDLGLCVAAGSVPTLFFEGLKWSRRRRRRES